jgi:tetratricopeptide (TPR) repeat protein
MSIFTTDMTKRQFAILPVAASLLISACDDGTAVRLRYAAEQRYFKADKELGILTSRPENVTAEKIREIAVQFRDISQFCFSASTEVDPAKNPVEAREIQNLTYQSVSRLSQLYFSAGMFDSCVSNLQLLTEKIPLTESQAREAYLNLGQALQSNRQWDSAIGVYEQAVLEFYPPLDSTGQIAFSVFNLPTHIFRLAVYVSDSASSNRQLTAAINYYQRFIRESSDSKLASASHANLARLYDDIGRWEMVVPELSALVDSTGALPAEIRIRIADTYATRLNENERAVKIYDSLLNETPATDTVLRPLLIFKKAATEIDQKKYSEGRELLVDLKERNRRFYMQNPAAQLAIARSFELEGNWSRAESEYEVLFRNFIGSNEGMNAYLHIADRFEKLGRMAEAEKVYANALLYFDEVATRGAGTLLEATALYFRAELFEQRRNWKEAVVILESIFDKFPDSDSGRNAVNRASQIARNKMNDPSAANALDEKLRAAVSKMRRDWES